MDSTDNHTVILHTYQQPTTTTTVLDHPTSSYAIAPCNQTNIQFGNGFDIATNHWCNPTFSASTYQDTNTFDNEIPGLPYANLKYETLKYGYNDGMFPKEPMATNIDDIKEQHIQINSCSSTSANSEGSVDCSISPEPIMMPSVKRGRPTENPCWSYFHRIDDQLVKCRICTRTVKSACATNMTKHLERHHSDDYEKLAEQIRLYSMKSKMHYQNPNDPNSLTTALANTYLVSRMDGVDTFDGQPPPYYELTDNTQQIPQFEAAEGGVVQHWQHNLSQFWQQMPTDGNMMGHIAEATTSAITTSVITSTNDMIVQQTAQKVTTPPKRTGPSERPYMKRNRKTEHPVWEYFKRTADGNAQCLICTGTVKSPCSSNFMRHLMRHHSSEYNNVYLKWIEKRTITHPGIQFTSIPPPQLMGNDQMVKNEDIIQ